MQTLIALIALAAGVPVPGDVVLTDPHPSQFERGSSARNRWYEPVQGIKFKSGARPCPG